MTPEIKICGITRLEDARFAAGAGAGYLGFVLANESPRFIEPDAARDICEWVFGCRKVGVFVDTQTSEINELVDHIGLDMAQLHGDESPWECTQVGVPVIKAIRVKPDDTLESLDRQMLTFAPHVACFVLDTYAPDQHGGTGTRFNWDLAAPLAARYPIFLAGGISPENLLSAVRTVRPYGLDLSSGVEASPGVKDFDRVNALFDSLRELETSGAA